MITYIIKFILCSGLLLLVYRVFLGNERLYRFNRFYLLFSLMFSLAVPFVTISVPAGKIPYLDRVLTAQAPSTKVAPIEQTAPVFIEEPIAQQNTPAVTTNNPVQQPIVQTPATDYLSYVLLGIYGTTVLILLLRFAKNSWHINALITKNTIVNYQDTKLVLIDEDVTPHSFLNYVFINKDAYQSGEVEPQIICHEQAHVRQLHSLDVIFVELLQVVFWFNPFIPFYRKAIQLNHEFLADEAVIENYQDAPAYQYLLLEKASQSGSLYLTSQFNYLITKKRLIMMTKNTSAKIAVYKKLAMVPLLAAAIFLFSQKSTAEILKATTKVLDSHQAKTVTEEYNDILEKYRANPNLKFTPEDKSRLIDLYGKMTRVEKRRQWFGFDVQVKYPPTTPQEVNSWFNENKTEIWLDGKRIPNRELRKHIPVVPINLKGASQNAKKGLQRIYLMTDKRFVDSVRKEKVDAIWSVDLNGRRVPTAADIEYAKYGSISTPPDPRDEEDALRKLQDVKYTRRNENHAEKDAPAEVMNAYNDILKKYDLKLLDGYGKGKLADISSADTAQMHKLFRQMSAKQQSMQYVKFIGAIKPMPKNKVTATQLMRYSSDDKKYGVWIDDKRVKNSELKKYKPEDFSQYYASNLSPILIMDEGYRYKVNLLTKKAYQKEYNKVMADQSDRMVKISVQKNQLQINTLPEFPDPVVLPKVKQAVPPPLKITGEVLYPGAFASKREMTAQEWLNAAGGITSNGSVENVQIFRAGKRVNTEVVEDALKTILLPGDSIYVPRRN